MIFLYFYLQKRMNTSVISEQLINTINDVFVRRYDDYLTDDMPIRYMDTNLKIEQVSEKFVELVEMTGNKLEANILVCDDVNKEFILYYKKHYVHISFEEDFFEEVEFKITAYESITPTEKKNETNYI